MTSPEIDYEARRAANIAKNNALIAALELKEAADGLGIAASAKASSSTTKGKGKRAQSDVKSAAKPVQSRKRPREEKEHPPPRTTRASARMAAQEKAPPPGETWEEKKKRLAENAAKKKRAEEALEAAAERERAARQPRHHELDLPTLLGHNTVDTKPKDADAIQEEQIELSSLRSTLDIACREPHPRVLASANSSDISDDTKASNAALAELKKSFAGLRVQSRAKVLTDRIYSMAYHPERTKDLIFFGDKIGELGIWDARAATDDDQETDGDNAEGGKVYRLQVHWPKTSKSAISCIKFNPLDAHSVLTSSYDCTLRSTSLISGTSTEIFHLGSSVLPSSFDINTKGNEIWLADGLGGVSQLDLREGGRYARRELNAKNKIGCISINPARPELLLTASNDRSIKIWDARMLSEIPVMMTPDEEDVPPRHGPPLCEADHDIVTQFLGTDPGKSTIVGEYVHGQSASSAYWDPNGQKIVSTSYDNQLRVWNEGPWLPSKPSSSAPAKKQKKKDEPGVINPSRKIAHDCQTGRWLTIFKAQWSPNPNAMAHFTVGNMKHSLDVITYTGEVVARLSDRHKISAVQAVTACHPSILERAASGNASGRCVLWAPDE